MIIATDVIGKAVSRLQRAAADREPCAPVRDLIGSTDVEHAYRVQLGVLVGRLSAGSRRVGRKIGLTSTVVQRQLGVGQPDYGVLLDDMEVPDGGVVPFDSLLQPRIEAEVAFRLQADLDGDITMRRVRDAVAGTCAAIEIVDSRIAGWDITITDTVADNASSGMFAVAERLVSLSETDPADARMTMSVNGEIRSTGTGRNCLGNPLKALLWLARTSAEHGDPLQAGELVLSGALGPMCDVRPGDRVTAEIEGLGGIRVDFGEKR